jgi:hypothetical protein
VRLLAQERGLEVVEWAAPTPTTWEEYKYQVGCWAALSRCVKSCLYS